MEGQSEDNEGGDGWVGEEVRIFLGVTGVERTGSQGIG